jgi:hypothetical protein
MRNRESLRKSRLVADRVLVTMFKADLDLPQSAEVVGWPEVQRFTREAQCRREKPKNAR